MLGAMAVPFPCLVSLRFPLYQAFLNATLPTACPGLTFLKGRSARICYRCAILTAVERLPAGGDGCDEAVRTVADMMISTKGRYALRLMIDIASREQDGSPVTMRQAAAREDLSVKYLEQLGGALVKAGDVLRATEGGCAPVACLEDGAEACPRRSECVAVNFWRGLDRTIEGYVDGVTLADLVKMG